MTERHSDQHDTENKGRDAEKRFRDDVTHKAERKMRRRERDTWSPWLGFSYFGIVGWSVAVPTLLGVALGVWLDSRTTGQVSWTLTFLAVGLTSGCLIAWYWLQRERERIEKRRIEKWRYDGDDKRG